MQNDNSSKPLPLAIAALQSAHFLAHATQGDTALTLEIGEVLSRLTALQPDLFKLVDDAVVLDPEAYGRVKTAFGIQPDLIPVYVIVKRTAHVLDLHELDFDLGGHYQVLVPGYLSDDLQAGLALDQFHSSVAIKNLDDFDISVAKSIECPDDYESNTLYKLGDFPGLTEHTLV